MPRLNNFMSDKLKEHIGHDVEIVCYGDWEDPHDICVECLDCGCVVISAEDFED